MATHPTHSLYTAAVQALAKRDRAEIRIVNAILSAMASSPRRARPHRARAVRRATAWRGFRSVLCPVDFSEQSRQALRHAEAVARRGHATLTVLYANDPLLVAAAAAALHDRALAARSAAELRAFVDTTVSPASRARLRIRTMVRTGSPAAEILRAARTSDLIVLGTHGLTGADRMLMGSTTAQVLQQARVPVLAVPRGTRLRTLRQQRAWPDGPVLAAIELGAASEHDADLAAVIARWFKSSLVLAHVVPETSMPAWLTSTLAFRQHDRARLARAERGLEALAAMTRRRVRTEVTATCGHLADEIAAHAIAWRAALVVTVLRHQRGGSGSPRGSVSYDLISHASTPVLAWPLRWRRS